MLFYYFFVIITLSKNCFNESINHNFSSVKNNWLAESITNTNNFVCKTARSMCLIFFSVIWSIIFSITNLNSFPITLKIRINLKWFFKLFSNLIERLLNFTVSLPFTFKQVSLFYQNPFNTKTLQIIFTKVFF